MKSGSLHVIYLRDGINMAIGLSCKSKCLLIKK
jgi:hypothetical protein